MESGSTKIGSENTPEGNASLPTRHRARVSHVVHACRTPSQAVLFLAPTCLVWQLG
ncbi:hypothetical protein CsSME_00029294 [Camellia sinensis var. sinensis]